MIRALILKEWRENRWLILGFIVLAPMLSVGLKLGVVGWEHTVPEDTLCLFVPGMLLLFLLAIAADLVAADSGSGRIAFYAALPVRPTTIWAAKGVFLAGAAVLYLSYLLALDAAILAIGGLDPARILASDSTRWLWLLAAVATAGAATFAFSAVIDRGLAVVLGVLVTLAVLAGIGLLITWGGVDLRPESAGFIPGCGLVFAAFVVASYAVMRFGRIHLGARLRRIAFAIAGFFVIAVPASSWAGVLVHHWQNIEPHHDDYRIIGVRVDRRGEWAVVSAGRSLPGAPKWATPPGALWAIRLRDGEIQDLSEVANGIEEFATSEAGSCRVHLRRADRGPDGKSENHRIVEYDLVTRETISIEAAPPVREAPGSYAGPSGFREERWQDGKQWRTRYVHPDGRKFDVPLGWYGTGTYSKWGRVLFRYRNDRETPPRYTWLSFESGTLVPLTACPTMLPTEPSEWAWNFSRERDWKRGIYQVNRVSLVDGHIERVLPHSLRYLLWGNSRWDLLQDTEGLVLLKRNRHEPVRVPGIEFIDRPVTARSTTHGTRSKIYVTDGQSAWLIDTETEVPEVEQVPVAQLPRRGSYFWFDGRRWVVWPFYARGELIFGSLAGPPRRLLPSRK